MDIIEPGWYQDPNAEGMQRYHDGSGWTEHTAPIQAAPEEAAPAEIELAGSAPTAGAPVQYEPPGPTTEPVAAGRTPAEVSPAPSPAASSGSRRGELAGLAFIGAFVGLLFGGFLFNGVGALTPLTVEPGIVERLEIDYNTGSQSNQRSYELHGVTESGTAWKITNEDAYRAVERQGYPQAVTVGIGDWTGTAEQVSGQGWEVDHQSTGARIGWGIAIGLLAIGGVFAAVLIGRSKKFGLAGGGLFAACYFLVGGWLGYVMFRWIQSG